MDHLAGIALAWHHASRKAYAAARAQEPFCLEDLDRTLGSVALHAIKHPATSTSPELGPLHVLRARLNEVPTFWGQLA